MRMETKRECADDHYDLILIMRMFFFLLFFDVMRKYNLGLFEEGAD